MAIRTQRRSSKPILPPTPVRQAKAPSALGAIQFVRSVAREYARGLSDGTSPYDGAFSVSYPAGGSGFSRKADAEAAAKAVRGIGYQSYAVKDGPGRYSIVINR